MALCAVAATAQGASVVRTPDVAVFDASETMVAIARNGAESGSLLDVYEAGTGTRIGGIELETRAGGLFFCSARVLLIAAEGGLHRFDVRAGSLERVLPLAPGESAVVSPRCDSVAIFGPERRDVALLPLAGGRKSSFEMPLGTTFACFSGDDGAIFMLATSGAIVEGELRKRRRAELPGADGEPWGIACIGLRGLAIGGEEVEVRHAAAARGARIPMACPLNLRGCAVSADGRTVATLLDAGGRLAKAVRFHSASRLKGVESARLEDEPLSIGLSPSGADAVVTFHAAGPVVVSRANGAVLRLALPGR